jgi:lysozyme
MNAATYYIPCVQYNLDGDEFKGIRRGKDMTIMKPVVVDIYRGDKVEDFAAMKAVGILGVIHKASQGKNYQDDCFRERRKLAEAAGLRYGAYHFCDNSDPSAQASNFISACGDLNGLLLAVDFENNPTSKSRNMSVAQLKQFLGFVMEKTGRSPKGIWIYGGSRLKEEIASDEDCQFFSRFPLWQSQYGPTAIPPKAWQGWRLWQYTGDGDGNPPHQIAGASQPGIDLNVSAPDFDIESEWAATDVAVAASQGVGAS